VLAALLSLQWIGPVSLAASVGAGCLFSLWPTRGRTGAARAAYGAAAIIPLAALIGWLLR